MPCGTANLHQLVNPFPDSRGSVLRDAGLGKVDCVRCPFIAIQLRELARLNRGVGQI